MVDAGKSGSPQKVNWQKSQASLPHNLNSTMKQDGGSVIVRDVCHEKNQD